MFHSRNSLLYSALIILTHTFEARRNCKNITSANGLPQKIVLSIFLLGCNVCALIFGTNTIRISAIRYLIKYRIIKLGIDFGSREQYLEFSETDC